MGMPLNSFLFFLTVGIEYDAMPCNVMPCPEQMHEVQRSTAAFVLLCVRSCDSSLNIRTVEVIFFIIFRLYSFPLHFE
jgi:hypothetical protein